LARETPRPALDRATQLDGSSTKYEMARSSSTVSSGRFVTRGGEKLAAALDQFQLDVAALVCADFGSHEGGFVDCLLQRGAARVYAIDTAYGTLAWKLRRDPRVCVLERKNAMHVLLPKEVDFVTIDVGWTPQGKILPAAQRIGKPGVRVLTLIKPHYEAEPAQLVGGVVPDEFVDGVMRRTLESITRQNWTLLGTLESPIRGHGGNREFLALLQRSPGG